MSVSLSLSLSAVLNKKIGAEFYALRDFDFDRYTFQILTVERPKPELIELLTEKGYQLMCTISDFGETLWVSQTYMSSLDFSPLPSGCGPSVPVQEENAINRYV
jgi:hypothetical protein